MEGNPFIYAMPDEIKSGKTSDIYFFRTLKILKEEGLDNVLANAEVTISSLPRGYPWAVLGGLRDTLKLLEGLPVDVYGFPEGSVVFDRDFYGTKVPVLVVRGPYGSFAIYETPMLGFLAVGSGIATKAARIKKVAGRDMLVISFGARRTHPAISPFNAFYAYIGGCDAVSCVLGAEKFLNTKPTGTMPHSLVIVHAIVKGDQAEAWRAFDKFVESEVPRIMLCDTYSDEKLEAVKAVEAVGPDKVWGIRLDTPSSRRGNFLEIIREVKWELKARGYGHVKIVVSGGIDERSVLEFKKVGVSAIGVGSAIANARIVDYALDITAVYHRGKWVPAAKRGKFTGMKDVYRCWSCMVDVVVLEGEPAPKCPRCGKPMEKALKPLIKKGKIVYEAPSPAEERSFVLEQLEKLDLSRKPWES